MAKLHEYQGKQILQKFDIAVPQGTLIRSSDELPALEAFITEEIVIKAQVWATGRAGLGLIRFASTLNDTVIAVDEIFGKVVNQNPVDRILIEQKLNIEREFYAAVIIDDVSQTPVMIFSAQGGSGIEDISRAHPDSVAKTNVDVYTGLKEFQARDLVRRTGIRGKLQSDLAELLGKLYRVARHYHARAAEINPIVITAEGKLVAADCRITIDDNAVYMFPELGIEVAREFDRPPTTLEKIAWEVEKKDYRGTFFFIQMEQDFQKGQGFIGFHGAGGGGSMMSMDAVMNQGFKIANFVDTSGNPPASKVYRAARIILAQKGIDGYFASGSGVASQEQFHSARGLVKAFMEAPLTVPAVVRLGGNSEEHAIHILERAKAFIPSPVEGYGKDDTPEFCAKRLKYLIQEQKPSNASTMKKRESQPASYQFQTVTGGTVSYDYQRCRTCETKICIETCTPQILQLLDGVPVLNISKEEAVRGKCTECLACEIECFFEGNGGGVIHLPVMGLEEI